MARSNLILAVLLVALGSMGRTSPSPHAHLAASMPLDPNLAAQWEGRVYTTAEGHRFGECGWSDWFFHKSKKVWFRLPDSLRQREDPRLYSYSGRPILHRGTWEAMSPSERARMGPVILWGDRVASGWGEGPDGTNHFLSIWTRWSLLKPGACGHPERFMVQIGSARADADQGSGLRSGGA